MIWLILLALIIGGILASLASSGHNWGWIRLILVTLIFAFLAYLLIIDAVLPALSALFGNLPQPSLDLSPKTETKFGVPVAKPGEETSRVKVIERPKCNGRYLNEGENCVVYKDYELGSGNAVEVPVAQPTATSAPDRIAPTPTPQGTGGGAGAGAGGTAAGSCQGTSFKPLPDYGNSLNVSGWAVIGHAGMVAVVPKGNYTLTNLNGEGDVTMFPPSCTIEQVRDGHAKAHAERTGRTYTDDYKNLGIFQ